MNDIDKLQDLIDKSDYIVFFGGAGVSTDSGIKDFRGKNGLYKEKFNDYPPEYLLSSDCLYNNSSLFYDYYRDKMNVLDKEPNDTHKYLKKLEDMGKLNAIITQNIDGLHQKAGSSLVLELHGSIYRNYCDNCKKAFKEDYIFNSNGIPRCSCGGLVRPDVVLYGEMLPDCINDAMNHIRKCDLLIAAGTSLTVQPASGLVSMFNKKLVIINDSPTPYDNMAFLVINKPLKEIFNKLK